MGAGPPRSIFVRRIMSKQRQLTAWLKPREGEPPAKRGRQDTDSDAEAASGPSPLLSSFSDPLTMSCLNFDPRKLSLSSDTRSPLQSCSKPTTLVESQNLPAVLTGKTCLVSFTSHLQTTLSCSTRKGKVLTSGCFN